MSPSRIEQIARRARMSVAQTQRILSGCPSVPDFDRRAVFEAIKLLGIAGQRERRRSQRRSAA
jgi:DNA-binding LacI/PurR family transcriptional regulator